MKKIMFVLTVLLLVVGVTQVRGAANELGAIWFIGDSITQSNADGDSAGSPRKSLYDLLMANGYSFTYTGHRTANIDGLPATGASVVDNLYHYHSGISGSVIGDDYSTRVGMTENMLTHWTSGRLDLVKPSIILIMLGANDIDQSIDLPNAPARLKALVQSIYDLPGIGTPSIYLASITPNRKSPTKITDLNALNAMVPGVVSDFQSQGKDIHFVDQFTAINDDYATLMQGDNLHPNAAGNEVMAQTWFDEITAPVTAVISATPLSGSVPLTVNFDATGTTADSAIVSYSWNFGDGATGTGITTSHTYINGGTHLAVLVATSASNQTGVASVEVSASEWPGAPTDFYGFDLHTFTTNGLDCKVAVPKTIAVGKPWVWRARFWGHQSAPDVALLGKGYHVVYVDVSNQFGSPTAVARFDAFYDFLTVEHNFDTRAVLEGMSRGGLAIYNWAAQNSNKVHCIYADAPVCDFKSWPGGFYGTNGLASSWAVCLSAYGFTEAEALAYGGNPVDNMQPLAVAGIPLLHVVGDTDTVVPVAENTALIESRYNAFGGWIEVIHKPGIGHEHGLPDPTPIIEFILNSMNYIHNLAATLVDETSATLNGLLSLPGTNYNVQVYWGLTDGGTNAVAWDHSSVLGSWSTGDSNRVNLAVSSLAADSLYYYTFNATNSSENLWDDAQTFSSSNILSTVIVDGVSTNVDAAYGSFASASDLVNSNSPALSGAPTYNVAPNFGPTANNDGTIGSAGSTSDITFWIGATAGDTYTITYALDTSVNTLGYDISSLQTIHGWGSNSGNQKNQNYTVEISAVGAASFSQIATVAYLPFSSADTAGSSKVTVTASGSGILASNVDEIRFTYTVPVSGGTQPSPTIREIDVFGVPTEDLSAEPPRFSSNVFVSNGNFYTQFTGVTGLNYQIEYSDNLISNSWEIVTNIVSLVASPMTLSLPITNSVGFYHVIETP